MPVEIIDSKKKNQIEVLKIIKRTRAKGADDEGLARIYEPGEEIRISGSGKLALLALKAATRDLDYDIEAPPAKKSTKNEKKEIVKEKIQMPKLGDMKLSELDDYADTFLQLDVKSFRTKPEKIAAIKAALKNANG